MFVFVAIDLVSALLLLGAFYLIWKEKRKYYSIRMVLPAVALLTLGRFCDILLEHPSLRESSPFGLSAAAYEILVASWDEPPSGGSHIVRWDASRYFSGLYLYRLTTDAFVQTRKMVLLK